MSAFLCDSIHLSACADTICALIDSDQDGFYSLSLVDDEIPTPFGLFILLVRENLNSLKARYPNDDYDSAAAGMCYEKQLHRPYYRPYSFRSVEGLDTFIRCYKALQCYAYQSCEHSAWEHSDVKKLVDWAMQTLANGIVLASPSYEKHEWGWTPEKLPITINV